MSTIAQSRTRTFARVLGPLLVLVPGIVALRAPDMGVLLHAFFANEALVWISGGLLVFAGLLIIALHQYWSSLAAVLISVFGWLTLVRGLALLTIPQLFVRMGEAVLARPWLVPTGFCVLILVGAWLTWTGWKPQAWTDSHSKA